MNPSSFVRLLRLACVFPALLLACSALPAQTPNHPTLPDQAKYLAPAESQLHGDLPRKQSTMVAPNRITEAIDPSRVQPLPHHYPSWANPQNNIGAASSPVDLTMVLSRSPQQQLALEKLLADQKNPSSPDFHHWLTPEEIGEQFGFSDADIQRLKSWIESQGLEVKWVSPSRTFIGFGGLAVTVGRAFGTEIHNYRVNGAERMSVSSDPMIPAALAAVVTAIYGLYTIEDHPFHAVTAPQSASPELTLTNGNHYVTPGDFQIIYDVLPQSNGSLSTIGIVGRSRTNPADFTNFMQITSTPFQMPTEVIPTAFGGVDPGPALTAPPTGTTSIEEQLEATLDVTRAGSIASGANLLLVTASTASGGIEDDAQYLVQTSPVPAYIMTISYGDCESDAGPSGVKFWDTLFQQAAAEGISVFVSSGDSGAAGCEQSFVAPSANPPAIGPNYICSSSYATCVGGTEFNDTGNPSTYWRPSSSSGSNLASAIGYIPEGGWNEPADAKGNSQLASSGGGISAVIATPSWQTGPGVPSVRAGRYTPDLSFTSSCHDSYFGCLAAGGGSCVVATNGSFSFFGFCGTSAAAPSMAGVAALVDTKMQYPVGNINPEIYAIAQNLPTTFHDATPATSGVATCAINTPSMCNNSTPGPTGLTGGQPGYPVTTGYDLVTGWGSLDINTFLANFATSLPMPTVTVTPSVTTIAAAQPMTFTVQVAGATGLPTPTGIVTLTSFGYNPPAATLTNGQATFAVPADTLPGSTHPTGFMVNYVPDLASAGIYFRASGTTSVNVTLITPTLTLAFSPTNPTTAQDLKVTATIDGGTGNPVPTGMARLYAPQGDVFSATVSGNVVAFVIPAGVLPPGSDSINVIFVPDSNATMWFAGANAMQNITITGGPMTTPTVTAAPSPASIAASDPITVTVKVAGAAGGPTPSGTVSVTGHNGILSAGLVGGTAQINAQPVWLTVGNDTLPVAYSGDFNYNAATTTINVAVGKANTTMLVTPTPIAITAADSLSVYITVLGFGFFPAPTGSMTLTSGNFTSAPVALGAFNSATFTIPGGTLPAGTDALTVSYPGDSNFNPVTGTSSVTVTPPPPPSFTVAATAVTIATPGATTGNTSTITVTPAGGFTGSVTLTASITTSPAGAQHLPTLSFGTTSPASVTSAGAATATLTVTTTAPTTGVLVQPIRPQTRWYPLGETALACVVLFGFRSRRRTWRIHVGMLLMLAAVSSAAAACGGSSTVPTPTPNPSPGTTLGSYVVTVTGTSGANSATTSLSVVVQ